MFKMGTKAHTKGILLMYLKRLQLQGRQSYMTADVLMVDTPINNVNKVKPQLQIKDTSNIVLAFPDLLALAQRPINLKTEEAAKTENIFKERAWKECNSDKHK